MARTITQIQAQIWTNVTTDITLGPMLTSISTVAVWWLWTWVVATAQWAEENLFDAHQAEVTSIIAAEKPHTLQWYVTMAKAFQYGDTLPPDTDVYNPVRTPGDPAFVVTFGAAIEVTNRLRLKVATGAPGSLSALTSLQLTALSAYIGRIKDAGVRVDCTSGQGDTFQPTMIIYYDPLVLNTSGSRIDGTAPTPAMDAVNAFLAEIPFNGRFVLDSFIAAMEAVPGVSIAEVDAVQVYYGMVSPIPVINWYTPDAGYLVLDIAWFGAHVSYVPYT